MDNNVIIRAVVDVPKAAAKLKKFTLKGATRWSFIQFAPESNLISASNGAQLQFISVQFEAVERGEKYKLANCAVGACSPKDIKAIAGRRVEIVVTAEKCTTMYYTTGGRNIATSTDYQLTKFYSDNGKLLCSCSTPLGYIIPPVTRIYNPETLNTSACISVDKKAAKTLAGLLKLCALDNVGSKQFAAVAVEFAAGESVAVIKSHLFSQYDNAAPVFTIDKHLLKLSTPAVGGGLYYVQASYLIDALGNDLKLHFAMFGKECKVITQSDNGTQIAIGCNSAAEKAQARAEAVSKDLAEGEKMEGEAQSAEAAAVDNAPPESAAEVDGAPPKACAAVDMYTPTTAKNAPPCVVGIHRKLVVFFDRPVLHRPRGDTLARWSKTATPVDYPQPP